MSLEASLYSFLKSHHDLAALVDDRIYPDVAPSGAAYPHITHQVISQPQPRDFSGSSGITKVGLQLDVWALDVISRKNVSEFIRSILDGKKGTIEGTAVRGIFLENRTDTEEPPADGKEFGIFRTRFDFVIWFRQAVPALT
jgi:hypothetical protein